MKYKMTIKTSYGTYCSSFEMENELTDLVGALTDELADADMFDVATDDGKHIILNKNVLSNSIFEFEVLED